MRIFKNKNFDRWAREVKLSDSSLKEAAQEIDNGLYEANLGGNIYKKRIALHGKGKSGGARTIVAFKINKHAFFIYGFAKNERANISDLEANALKKLARIYFGFSDVELAEALRTGQLVEVK